jgi:hypothetical protein
LDAAGELNATATSLAALNDRIEAMEVERAKRLQHAGMNEEAGSLQDEEDRLRRIQAQRDRMNAAAAEQVQAKEQEEAEKAARLRKRALARADVAELERLARIEALQAANLEQEHAAAEVAARAEQEARNAAIQAQEDALIAEQLERKELINKRLAINRQREDLISKLSQSRTAGGQQQRVSAPTTRALTPEESSWENTDAAAAAAASGADACTNTTATSVAAVGLIGTTSSQPIISAEKVTHFHAQRLLAQQGIALDGQPAQPIDGARYDHMVHPAFQRMPLRMKADEAKRSETAKAAESARIKALAVQLELESTEYRLSLAAERAAIEAAELRFAELDDARSAVAQRIEAKRVRIDQIARQRDLKGDFAATEERLQKIAMEADAEALDAVSAIMAGHIDGALETAAEDKAVGKDVDEAIKASLAQN